MSAPNIAAQGSVRFTTPINDIKVVDAVIAINTDTSGTIDARYRQILGLQMPAAWTAAGLYFEGSHDGTTFVNIFHGAAEYELNAAAGAAASSGISLDPEVFAPWPYVRIVSGAVALKVDQLAARTIKVLTRAG